VKRDNGTQVVGTEIEFPGVRVRLEMPARPPMPWYDVQYFVQVFEPLLSAALVPLLDRERLVSIDALVQVIPRRRVGCGRHVSMK
jgi:hypothetical protein